MCCDRDGHQYDAITGGSRLVAEKFSSVWAHSYFSIYYIIYILLYFYYLSNENVQAAVSTFSWQCFQVLFIFQSQFQLCSALSGFAVLAMCFGSDLLFFANCVTSIGSNALQ
jgi:hypothetical protein